MARFRGISYLGLVAAVVLCTAAAHAIEPLADRWPDAARAYGVAVDGQPRWGGHVDTPLPPASLTKLLAALVLVDGTWWRSDAVVTVSRQAADMPGSRLGLKAGERLRAGDLLAAMLVRSANDACMALAEHAAGSVQVFVERMNAKAGDLGLAGTAMENPCGFDGPGHRSTVRDLLALADAAMTRPEVAAAVALPRIAVETLGGRRLEAANTNKLIGSLDGARGLKTGYTSGAGHCLIARAERNGRSVTVVLLGARERWWTTAAIIEDAFDDAL